MDDEEISLSLFFFLFSLSLEAQELSGKQVTELEEREAGGRKGGGTEGREERRQDTFVDMTTHSRLAELSICPRT